MNKKAAEKSPKKPTDEALATLMLDRQERVQRCGKAIEEALKTERCSLSVSHLDLIEGRISPVIKIAALD